MKLWYFGWPYSRSMNQDNDSKVIWSTKECALWIVKVEIYTKYKQGKIESGGSTMVLGKWLPCEHIGVRHICCRSTMVLGKWLSCLHLGVRHMVWQKIDDLTLPCFSGLQQSWVEKGYPDSREKVQAESWNSMISISRPRKKLDIWKTGHGLMSRRRKILTNT